MNRFHFFLLVTVLAAAPAFAHDPKFHKGPKVEGIVVSVEGNRLHVVTKSETVAVTLSPETKIEQASDGKQDEKSSLRKGQHVMVVGHKLESGGFVASEVMIHGDHDEAKTHNHPEGGK